MKKILSIVLFVFILSNITVQSQEKASIKIESKNGYAEKIYLQPVSTVFTTDKTIWFKAIVTDLEHIPTKLSAVLHVDLIDFDENIIDSKLLKIENGIADGYFDLNEELPSGRYLIRGYTEWNKNFDRKFISQTYVNIYAPKEIKKEDLAIREVTLQETSTQQYELSAKAFPQLLNPKFRGNLKMYIHTGQQIDSLEIKKDKNDIYHFTYLLPKNSIKVRLEIQLDSIKARNFDYKQFSSYSKTVVINKEYLDLQFFPEGGKLVNGLTSKVAFKALDYNNKGKQVFGYIVDEKDNIITPFQSNALGMGTTYLTPELNKNYYAVVKGTENIEYKYPLPKIHKTGVVLKIKEVEEFIVLSLQSNQPNQEPLHIKAQVRGVVYDEFDVIFKNSKVGAGIEKNLLPEGIVKFTITNLANQIVAERLFFNYKEEDRINITASLNKPTYKQREKTVITLNTKDKDSNAIKTNLSVLVINKEQLGKEHSLRSNILSYFLLNSELRGSIEKSNEYFNPKNKRRKYDLDALLLTQGWSNYKYENTAFTNDFRYFPEKGLTISGRIKNQWFSKRELKKTVELTAVYGPLNVAIQEIDSSGYFNMKLEDYYKDEFRVALQTKNEKGNKKDYTIELSTYKVPKVNYKKVEKVDLADSVSVYVKKNIIRKQKAEDYTVADGTIGLDEVTITGYNMTPQRQKVMDLHGAPDIVVENKELLENTPTWHYGLGSVLESSFPDIANHLSYVANRLYDATYNKTYANIRKYAKLTFYLVDGILVSDDDVKNLPPEEIKSVELLKNPKRSMYYISLVISDIDANIAEPEEIKAQKRLTALCAQVTILSIYTYAGKGINYVRRNKGIDKFSIQGFATKREFYAPKYDKEDLNDWSVPDLRSVVHWSATVVTDTEGKAQVEFYNGDDIGEMLIIIEGITENGKIGYFETSYTVGKKLE